MRPMLLALCLLAATRAAAAFDCTDDMNGVRAGDKCYFIPLDHPSDWDGARRVCESYNGNLAMIRNAGENAAAFSTYQLNNDRVQAWNRVWLALTDHDNEGDFRWSVDNSRADYNNWTPGEPNDGLGRGEDCAVMWRDKGEWNDIPCHLRAPALCEVDAWCAERGGVHDPNRRCIFLLEELGTWEEARDACRAEDNSDLVSIHAPTESTRVQRLVQQDSIANMMGIEHGWIGYLGMGEWTDRATSPYTNWAPDRTPTVSSGNAECTCASCVAVEFTDGAPWQTMPCDTRLPAICARSNRDGGRLDEPVVSCDVPWEYYAYDALNPIYMYFDPLTNYFFREDFYTEIRTWTHPEIEHGCYDDFFAPYVQRQEMYDWVY